MPGDELILPAKDLLEKFGLKVCGAGATPSDAVKPVEWRCGACRWRSSPFRRSRLGLRRSRGITGLRGAPSVRPSRKPKAGACRGLCSSIGARNTAAGWTPIKGSGRGWLAEGRGGCRRGVASACRPDAGRLSRHLCGVYSLGNAVYPKSLGALASWRRPEIGVFQRCEVLSSELVRDQTKFARNESGK